MKNTVMEAFVRPKVLVDALETLKKLGNPHYQNITIDFDYYEKNILDNPPLLLAFMRRRMGHVKQGIEPSSETLLLSCVVV